MANPNIGLVKCPLSGVVCVVRADKRQKLYYFSPFGKIAPNLPAGQEWLKNVSTIFDNGVCPDNVEIKTEYPGMPPKVTIFKQGEKPKTDPQPQKAKGIFDFLLSDEE